MKSLEPHESGETDLVHLSMDTGDATLKKQACGCHSEQEGR